MSKLKTLNQSRIVPNEAMTPSLEHKFEDCDCHQYYEGERFTCNMACIKCGGAKEVITIETKDSKTVTERWESE